MPIAEGLCCFALRQFGMEGADAVTRLVMDQFSDQGQLLLRALDRANRNAWKSLEVALAGESLWSRLADRADEKAFRQQLRLFLDHIPLPELANRQKYRQQCLQDLQTALGKGVLLGQLVPAALAQKAGPLSAHADPQGLLRAERQALQSLASEIRSAGFESLGWLLDQPAAAGDSVVVLAVRFFFRREVERNPQLAAGLQLTAVEDLGASQRAAFQGLDQTLTGMGQRLDHALALASQEIRSALAGLDGTVRQQGEQVQGRLDGMEQTLSGMQSRMDQLLDRLGMLHQPVRAGHSLSIHNDRERQLVKELLGSYRQLPLDIREGRPELVSRMGKLLLAAGEFQGAEESFQQAARLARTDSDRAEAHHNAYRAALEQKEYGPALRELLQASEFAPERFAPFPLDRYEPLAILGAGGFGVTFLCRHTLSRGKVAVKSLTTEDLDRDGATVLQEAGTLEQVRHPAVISLRDCGYADRDKRRPYLVMEYFEGPTLEEQVREKGPLPLEDVLRLGRTLAEGLQAAHARQLLHRDVKPANVLLRKEGKSWEVRIIDFGLALRQDLLASASTMRQGKTIAAGAIAGTIDYAAPEQMGKLAGARVGPQADVYGFGRTLTYALFGTPEATWHQYRTLPPEVAEFLSHCVQQKPADRPGHFEEVLDRLGELRQARKASSVPLQAALAMPVAEAEPVKSERKPRIRHVEDVDEMDDAPRRPRPVQTTTGLRVFHAFLAFWFGALGLHKFAQGNTQAGITRLLILCTCIGIYSNAFIGMGEAVKYISMSNEDYDREYMVGKKAWF